MRRSTMRSMIFTFNVSHNKAVVEFKQAAVPIGNHRADESQSITFLNMYTFSLF